LVSPVIISKKDRENYLFKFGFVLDVWKCFFGKVVLLAVKEFYGLPDDLKITWNFMKTFNPYNVQKICSPIKNGINGNFQILVGLATYNNIWGIFYPIFTFSPRFSIFIKNLRVVNYNSFPSLLESLQSSINIII